MSVRTRAKFRCTEEGRTFWTSAEATHYRFDPVYDPDIPEDVRYATATPTGKLELTVTNPSVSFELGSFYYLDLVAVDADHPVADSAS